MFDDLFVRYLRAPEHPGKLRVVRALARTIVPEGGVVARVAEDLKLYLHPRDWIEYLLLRGDAYEPLTLAFLQANLRPGEVAVFAGTNFGLHLARAARSVGEAGLVIGVEPQPAALLRTRLNLTLNDLLSNVKLVQGRWVARRRWRSCPGPVRRTPGRRASSTAARASMSRS